MKTFNVRNERVKHRYLDYRKNARGYSDASLETIAKALSRFDAFNKYRDFGAFRAEQAVSFKDYLYEQKSVRTGQPLSASTIHSTLRVLRTFFLWLSHQRGYRSKLEPDDTEYFRVSMKEARIATAHRVPTFPMPEQIVQAILAMPSGTDVERRDQALVAFIFLTAARDSAAISIRVGDIDLRGGHVIQDARHVRTKNAKTIFTGFFPVDARVKDILVRWITYLRVEKGWGADKPAFPATARVGNDWRAPSSVIDTTPWKTSGPVRKIFRNAFERIGLPYFNPHSVRHTIAHMGETRCRNDAERKAWSQNMGHEHVKTTLDAYAPMDRTRQLEVMRNMSVKPADSTIDEAIVRKVVQILRAEKSNEPPGSPGEGGTGTSDCSDPPEPTA